MIQRLRQMRNEEGFTLIELLIVIIVLGILAAIVVFAVGNTRSDAVESACRTGYKSVELSAEAIKTKTGSYPAGTFNSTNTAATNPVLEGNAADNGALLKDWPSGDYDIAYSYTAGDANFALTVLDGPGGSAVEWDVNDNGTVASGETGPGVGGCSAL